MSRLPNAPLQEVSARVSWHVNKDDVGKYDFFADDYFNKIKNNYNERHVLNPNGRIPFHLLLNVPTHKFTSSHTKFPFIAIGPGIAVINVNDEHYFWSEYIEKIKFSFNPIFDFLCSTKGVDHIHLFLEYINFFEMDINNSDIITFLKEKLHTEVNQQYFNGELKPKNINLEIAYELKDIGHLKICYNVGKLRDGREGLIVRTIMSSGSRNTNIESSMMWFGKMYNFCSNLFKQMTKGELYESFK